MQLKKWLKYLLFFCAAFILTGILSFNHIERFSKPFMFDKPLPLPACKTAIVLGTSRYLHSGIENLYFTYRINAAEQLYRSKKASIFILSGDNSRNSYNEPQDMKNALMARGIPDSCLVLDYAGLRTFDSMLRCKQIFGQDSVIIVSQQFHNSRAVFIGRKTGLMAFGLNAQEVTTQKAIKIKIREFFSRIKCVLDIYVLNTEPKHLGEKIKI